MANVKWRNQLLLALALFVLGSAVYWLEFRYRPAKEGREEQAQKLFRLKDVPVHRIRLAAGKKIIELKCSDPELKLCRPGDNAKWELSEPLKVSADDSNVNSFVSTLNNIASKETISLESETPAKKLALLKEYGLDPVAIESPSINRVEVETPSERMTLFLGLTHPISNDYFALKAVQKEGDLDPASKKADQDLVFLVPSYFKTNLEKDLTYWRDKKLLTISSHDVASFELQSKKGGKIAGVRKEGQWVLQGSYPGDIENIDSMLSSAVQLSAKEFVTDRKDSPAGKVALRGARRELTLELVKKAAKGEETKGEAITLTMYRAPKTEKLLAVVSNLDPVFELEAAAFNRLNKDLKDLRLVKLITSLERFTARRLEFSGTPIGRKPLVLVQSDGKWVIQAQKKPVDEQKIDRFLEKVTGNRIKEFIAGGAVPAGEKDGLKWTLGDEKTDAKRQFVFWKSQGKLYAKDLLAGRKNEAFLIDNALLEELPWSRAFFESTAAEDVAAGESDKES